ncbi:MAG: ndbB [Microbacterium sp.]|nr:ndbB [Microbacterium sp.]
MTTTVPQILIVGGGYAGFYTAWKLEKHLRKGEAEVTMVDPLPYMTYQPFLPEVAAGEIEPRHVVVGHRRHLKYTNVVSAKVTGIDHSRKVATITPAVGEPWEQSYDQIVVTAGSVSRTFPIPGIADNAIGLKTIEEAVAIRDRILANFDKAATLPAGPERDRLLTVVVVGGGFAGIEVFAELRAMASSLVKEYPSISFEDTHFHLIEAMGRIMPEVSLKTSEWVLKSLAKRGANGRIRTRADLRVGTEDEFVEGAWAAGDVSAVPDLTGGGVGGYCVPNAQHAVRQAKLLAKNLVAVLRGELPKQYVHKNLGAVAGLGLYNGVFQSGNIAIKGFFAWIAHRGYHGLAMPTFERKFRVVGDWVQNLFHGRDNVSLITVQQPREVFEQFAARPRPPQPAAEAAPAEQKQAAAGDRNTVAAAK